MKKRSFLVVFRALLFSFILYLISFVLLSCTAIHSTVNAIGSNLSSVFHSPHKIEDRITEPFLPEARLAVLWIGHASALIQIDDKMILTDPVFTTTVGQFSKRLTEPGIDHTHLPDLDAVLISHMHIDHLSPKSLEMIETKIRHLIIPRGGLVYIPNLEFSMLELATWQEWEQDGLKITATPVVHNGWRYGLDDGWMTSSYSGYIIEYNGITVYFSGDTAYDSTLFSLTADKFPAIDLALLPVAPIHPREYSQERHTDPLQAIQIMKDLGAERLIPIHYDTFPESLDTLGEAGAVLKTEMQKQNLSDDQVVIMYIGQQEILIDLDKKRHLKPITHGMRREGLH